MHKNYYSKEKENNSIKSKSSKKTLCLNDLKYIHKNNNLTDRNIIKNGDNSGRNQYNLNHKFKLMLDLQQRNNKKIAFSRHHKNIKKNNIYLTENNHTLKIKNINNNYFKKKQIYNETNSGKNKSKSKSKNKNKNKGFLTESITKIRISDFLTDRNSHISIK